MIEKEYWDITKELNLIRDVTPINNIEEMFFFLDAFKNNKRYNPQFKYEKTNNHLKLKQLNDIKIEFQKKKDWISSRYLQLISDTIKWVKLFQNRNSSSFPKGLTKIYGIPSDKITIKALKIIISESDASQEYKNIKPAKAKVIMTDLLKEQGLKDWSISLENMTAKMSVNNNFKLLKINQNSFFSHQEIERLKVHEIGTHIRRHENGLKQNNLIFAKGLPNYLSTEEGLAILSEHKTGVSSIQNMKKYAMRVLLSKYSTSFDFYDLFKFAKKHFPENEAYSLTARIKRGFTDTSNLGGYTKDQVYLKGFIEVNQLTNHELKKLFIGKISIKDLDDLPLKNININVNLPNWLN